MSDHRRKQPQGRGRRAAQQPPSGRRAGPPRDNSTGSPGQAGQAPPPPPSRPPGPPPGQPPGVRAESPDAGTPQGGTPRAGTPRAGTPRASGGGRRRAASAASASASTGAGTRAAARGRGKGRGRGAQARAKKRFIDYPRSDRDGLRRFVPSWKQVLGTFAGFVVLLMGLVGIAYAMVEVPDPNKTAISQKNVYYWANGERMVSAGGGDQNRQIVELPQIAQSMQDAVIAAENESFYKDAGVDPMGVARAMFKMATGGDTQSGSTITQQYVKNNYLDQSQTLTRKAKELLISIKVGAQEEKDDILAGYLNTAYYGRGAYGIQAASVAYYGKDAADLSESESALLAAVLNGPNLYDPHGGEGGGAMQTAEKNRERAEARWEWILNREVKVGRLDQADRDKIKKFPMPKRPQAATNLKGQIGYLVNRANADIINNTDITKKELDRGGYEIHTTFDKKKTLALEKSVNKIKKENFDPEKRKQDKFIQFGGASVKPGDGAIVALYGGEDAVTHFVNNAGRTGAAVGSTFKPFVMAAAMRDGVRDPDGPEDQGSDTRTLVSPTSKYNGDNKVKLLNYNGDTWLDENNKEWHQKNDMNESYGDISLRDAMKHSANTPFIQLGMDVGLEKVKSAAMDAGVSEDSLHKTLTPSFSLGISAPSAIEMAGSYATFAQSGEKAETYSVTEVKKRGSAVYKHEKKTERAFDSNVADTVTSMLETVAKPGGTGSKAAKLGRPAAVKTGTTDDNKTAWFTGYTKQLSTSIGMWRMDDKAESPEFLPMYGTGDETGSQQSVHGASFPADVWVDYMGGVTKNDKVLPFPKPGPIGEKVCSHTSCPSPTPTQTEEEPEPEPEPTEEESEKPEKPSEKPKPPSPSTKPPESPDPTESCYDWGCVDEGTTTGPGGEIEGGIGEIEGGDPGGGEVDGGTTDTSGNGNGTGNPNGGDTGETTLWGGPTGERREE